MPSQVGIINMALGKLAQDVGIAALSDKSKPARVYARLWDPMRDLVLADRNWPWAMKAERLAVEAESAMPGWTYRYARPSDCITAIAVTDESGLRAGRRMSLWCDQEFRRRHAHDFESAYGEQGTSLMADLPEAWLVYVVRVKDPARYPPHFVEALACKLAEESAPAIVGDKGLNAKTGLKQLYLMALSEAAAHDYNESGDSVDPMTPAMAARR